MEVREHIKGLERSFSPEDTVCVIVWQTLDVQARVEEMDYPMLTQEKINRVLELIEKKATPDDGCTLLLMDICIEEVLEDRD